MAKQDTKIIYIGDSYFLRVRCWEYGELQAPRGAFGGTEQHQARSAITPLAAIVRLINFETSEQVPLGLNGEDAVDATIDGQTVSCLIDPSFINAEGQYRAFLTLTFADGRTTTESSTFRVSLFE